MYVHSILHIYVMTQEFCISQYFLYLKKACSSVINQMSYLLWSLKMALIIICTDMLTKALFSWIPFVLQDNEITKILCQLHQSCYEQSSLIDMVILSLWHLQIVLLLLGYFPEGSAMSYRQDKSCIFNKGAWSQSPWKRTIPSTLNCWHSEE